MPLKRTEVSVETIARVFHDANAGLCQSLGDTGQLYWNDAPQSQRDSSIAQVKNVLANPTITPEQSHESWCGERLSQEWKYGPVTDRPGKIHSSLKPYLDRPFTERAKDALINAVVNALGFSQE